MFVELQIDTDSPLSDTDRQVLRLLAGLGENAGAQVVERTYIKDDAAETQAPKKTTRRKAEKPTEPVEEPEAPTTTDPEVVPVEEPTPQPKKAPARKPQPKPSEPVEEAPAEESPEADGDVKARAVQLATDAIAAGRGAAVKAALAEVGARRVSVLSGDQYAAFIAAMSDDD